VSFVDVALLVMVSISSVSATLNAIDLIRLKHRRKRRR